MADTSNSPSTPDEVGKKDKGKGKAVAVEDVANELAESPADPTSGLDGSPPGRKPTSPSVSPSTPTKGDSTTTSSQPRASSTSSGAGAQAAPGPSASKSTLTTSSFPATRTTPVAHSKSSTSKASPEPSVPVNALPVVTVEEDEDDDDFDPLNDLGDNLRAAGFKRIYQEFDGVVAVNGSIVVRVDGMGVAEFGPVEEQKRLGPGGYTTLQVAGEMQKYGRAVGVLQCLKKGPNVNRLGQTAYDTFVGEMMSDEDTGPVFSEYQKHAADLSYILMIYATDKKGEAVPKQVTERLGRLGRQPAVLWPPRQTCFPIIEEDGRVLSGSAMRILREWFVEPAIEELKDFSAIPKKTLKTINEIAQDLKATRHTTAGLVHAMGSGAGPAEKSKEIIAKPKEPAAGEAAGPTGSSTAGDGKVTGGSKRRKTTAGETARADKDDED